MLTLEIRTMKKKKSTVRIKARRAYRNVKVETNKFGLVYSCRMHVFNNYFRKLSSKAHGKSRRGCYKPEYPFTLGKKKKKKRKNQQKRN